MKMRFHLDEHVPWAIAAGLRQHGVDVTTTRDAGLEGKDDDDHLVFALADDRVTVSHDDDFLALHAAGTEHAGIAYCHQEKYPVGELLRRLLLLHEVYTQEEMRGRVEFL